jgi:predicted RNA-binding Zn ribbon-like protein
MKSSEIASSRIFQLVAAHPVLDFVNTVDWRFREIGGPEELLENYSDLIHFSAQSNLLTSRQAQHLLRTVAPRKAAKVLDESRELREALAEFFYCALDGETPTAIQLKIMERHFQAARLHQKLQWKDSRLNWTFTTEDTAELPMWLLALRASDLITSDAMAMVHACNNSECKWLFLDTSKNHTKRWCDMKLCGNRMKARRFKAQRAS